jgi:hypothetical protein
MRLTPTWCCLTYIRTGTEVAERTYIQSAFRLLFGFQVFELVVAELGQLVVSLGRADAILVHSARDLGRVVKCLVGSGGREKERQAAHTVGLHCTD